ncbi:MAG: hypothetical protein WAT66_06165 [Actinomycetota bacterium]
MTEPVAFCPSCGQPTRHATDADRLDFDLKQWRSHVKGSTTNGNGKATSKPASRVGVATATRDEQRFVASVPGQTKRRFTMPSLRVPRLRMPQRRRRPDVEINLDTDDPFAYSACVTCGATDWILRGPQNDDGTYPYWCVRCSRAFKTTVRLAHGRKPFIAAGTVVAVLIFFLYLLR